VLKVWPVVKQPHECGEIRSEIGVSDYTRLRRRTARAAAAWARLRLVEATLFDAGCFRWEVESVAPRMRSFAGEREW